MVPGNSTYDNAYKCYGFRTRCGTFVWTSISFIAKREQVFQCRFKLKFVSFAHRPGGYQSPRCLHDRTDCALFHFIYFLTFSLLDLTHFLTARVVLAPQMISQSVSSIFLCSQLPSGAWRTPGLSIHWCCLPTFFFICLPCLLPPFTMPYKMVLARPDERETCPYYSSLRLFLMVRRSSCGPIACWILAQTSSLVTWSLYKMSSILR